MRKRSATGGYTDILCAAPARDSEGGTPEPARLGDNETAGRPPAPLCGLVLAGGRSSRMGRDKASLTVHGRSRPQYRFLFEELRAVCGCAFISGRGRSSEAEWADLPVIRDTYSEVGPMAGLLSAMEADPKRAWLLVGVDLVNVGRDELGSLVAERDPEAPATAAYNPAIEAPEPLFAIYEPGSFESLLARYRGGRYSLRQSLQALGARLCRSISERALRNANTPEELAELE